MMQTIGGTGADGLRSWVWFFGCGLVGIATGIAFVYITQYYTAGSWRPVQEIAEASQDRPATNIIIGTAVGFETTAVTAIAIGIALVATFLLGEQARAVDGDRGRRRRHLRHRRRHDGHADVRRLHPGDGHLRPDHRQRRWHHEFSDAEARTREITDASTRSATPPRR